jgi:hypothetical protein
MQGLELSSSGAICTFFLFFRYQICVIPFELGKRGDSEDRTEIILPGAVCLVPPLSKFNENFINLVPEVKEKITSLIKL